MTSLLLFAAACGAGAAIGQYFPTALPGLPLYPFWPPAGLLLAALLRADARQWRPWLLVAGGVILASLILRDHPWPMAVAVSALTLLEAAVAATLLRRVIGEPLSLARVSHVWWLIIVCVAVPMVTGGAAAVAGMTTGAAPLDVWRGWWFAGTLGILLFTPITLALMTGAAAFVEPPSPLRIVEAITVIVSALIVAAVVFGGGASPVMRVPAYILPFMLWAAFRLEPGGAAATLLAVGLVALWNTSHGEGPFSVASFAISDWILRAQGAMAIASVSILLLASVIAERKQTARERSALLEQLQRALAEIKTLQGLIPICAWCQKVRDDAGSWQGIEAYVQTHSDATFSHSICPECNTEMQSEIQDETLRNTAR